MSSRPRYQFYIGGRFVDPVGGEWFETVNPYTSQPWAQIPRARGADVAAAVEAASVAFEQSEWSAMTAAQRGVLLHRLADRIAERGEDLARTETRDNGKLLSEMRAQLGYIPQIFRYFAGLADKVVGAVVPLDRPDAFAYTRKEPLGVIAAITPWNSPLLLATFKLAPALAAGNTIVLKPSEHASASTLVLAKVVHEAGFPAGVLNVITGFGDEAGRELVVHDKVAKVAFTGGDVGRFVAQSAIGKVKGVLLELGGKSANIVFDDADLENALNGVIAGIFAASGQTCIAGSRLLVQSTIYEKFLNDLVERASQARLGDPADPNTQVGPVTTRPQFEKILSYIAIAKAEGATCRLGGEALGEGLFIRPTIFADVSPDMRIAREEVFGPVLSVIPFDTEEEAVAIANGTAYGLAAGVWTQNLSRAHRVEKRLKAGTVWINTYRAVSVQLPFGGYKESGIGRELGSASIDEFMETKSVWINLAPKFPNPFIMQ